MPAPEIREARREPVGCKTRLGAKSDSAFRADLPTSAGIVDQVKCRGNLIVIEFSSLRQEHAIMLTQEQFVSEIVFQKVDMPAHRANGNSQLSGSCAQASCAAGNFKSPQGVQGGQMVSHMSPF